MGVFGNEFVNEGSGNLHKALIGFKIKPHQDLAESAKKGSYPGLLDLINKSNSIDDIKYIKLDVMTTKTYFKTIIKRIEECKGGETPENKKYYENIKKLYLDKDVTASDIRRYEKWLNEVLIPRANERIKELSKKDKK